MRRASSLPVKWQIVTFSITALLVVVADQLSKTWIRSNLAVGHSLPEVGFFRLTHVRNTGAAFGLFQGQSGPLTIVAIVGIMVLLLYALLVYRQFPFLDSTPVKVTLGLVLGGTVGNLTDRIRFGYVTDFVDVGFWPAFNVADSAIVIGTILFAYSLISRARAGKHQIMSQ